MTQFEPITTPEARPAGRIRQQNRKRIMDAATREFARHGFRGTSMSAIAQRAGLPKANLHYYFSNKLNLYMEVLRWILELWDQAFGSLSVEDDPASALAGYIRARMEFSRRHPLVSKVFAMEIISGCECLSSYYNQDYRVWFRQRTAVLEDWIRAGKMAPVEPLQLVFLIWSSTKFYADFSEHIRLVTDQGRMTRHDFDQATDGLIQLILRGCGLTPPARPTISSC